MVVAPCGAWGDCPADNSAADHIGDERDVAKPGENPDVGDVRDPELLRAVRDAPPLDQVGTLVNADPESGGDGLGTSSHTLEANDTHQPRYLVTADNPSCAAHCVPHLPDPVDAVVLLVDPPDLPDEEFVAHASSRCLPAFGGAVSTGGDDPTFFRTEDAADGLDPELLAMHVDERDHFVVGRSSSAAEKLRRLSESRSRVAPRRVPAEAAGSPPPGTLPGRPARWGGSGCTRSAASRCQRRSVARRR